MILFEKTVIDNEKVVNYFYLNRYENIVKSEIQRKIDFNYEKHHIIPKCMGGSNDIINILKCRRRVHFLLHFILNKAFPKNKGLYTACLFFKEFKNSRLYERSKKYQREYMINNNPAKEELVRKKISVGVLKNNLILTEEQKKSVRKKLSTKTQERIRNKTHNFIENHPMNNKETKEYILSKLNSDEKRKITSERQKCNNSIISVLNKIEQYMLDNNLSWNQAALECKDKKITRCLYSEETYIKWLKSRK